MPVLPGDVSRGSWLARLHGLIVSRRYVVDAVVAGVVFAATLAPPYLGAASPSVVHWVVVLAVVQSGPLAWRRRWPVGVFVVVGLATLASSLVAHSAQPPVSYALLVALYTVAANGRRGIRIGCLAASLVASVFASHQLVAVALFGLTLLTAYALGASARARSVAITALKEQERRAAHGRELTKANAAAEERARIAHDLHDILAHLISTMVVQAEAATVVVGSDPQRAIHMMDRIADGGRDAMIQVRHLLGLLEPAGAQSSASAQPVADLPALVTTFRNAGLAVEVSVCGRPAAIERDAELTIYRVVQESLTNTLRHSRARQAWLDVSWDRDAVTVRVRDDGRGLPISVAEGRGLGGLRERVAACGGSVEIGTPAGTTGFHVIAVLPLCGHA